MQFFSIPGFGPVQKFDYASRSSFEAAINKLKASDGGDCPEKTFNGIIDAIKIGEPLPGSPMYVFVDAPPKAKDDYNRENAIGYALEYMMPVNFFFSTQSCGDPGNNADYQSIVKDTGGMGLFFSNASSISSTDTLVAADLDGSTVISSGDSISGSRRRRDLLDLFSRSSSDVPFPVDSTVKTLIISISASRNWNHVKVVDSAGRNVAHSLNTNRGKLWMINNPSKGNWRVTVPSNVSGLAYQVSKLLN